MEPIQTDQAPAAIGPYSQALRCGDMVFLSGQIALAPDSGELVSGGINAEISQVFDNLLAVVAAAGARPDQIARITVYLTDLAHFGRVNEAMAERLQAPYPARAAVGVAALPRGASVEVDAVLWLG